MEKQRAKKQATQTSRKTKPRTRPIAKETVEPRTRDEFVVVYTSNGPLGAQVVKGKLESAGIPAMLKYETVESVFPLTVDGLGEVQVLVHAEDQKKARRILGAMPGE